MHGTVNIKFKKGLKAYIGFERKASCSLQQIFKLKVKSFLSFQLNIAYRYAYRLGTSLRRPQPGLNEVGKKFLFPLALKPESRTALICVITQRVVVISY